MPLLQARYQGVDWRDERNWGCNAAENPFNYAIEDPVGLAPMELMFVKVKRNILDLGSRSARAAAAYSGWHGSHEVCCASCRACRNPTSLKCNPAVTRYCELLACAHDKTASRVAKLGHMAYMHVDHACREMMPC